MNDWTLILVLSIVPLIVVPYYVGKVIFNAIRWIFKP